MRPVRLSPPRSWEVSLLISDLLSLSQGSTFVPYMALLASYRFFLWTWVCPSYLYEPYLPSVVGDFSLFFPYLPRQWGLYFLLLLPLNTLSDVFLVLVFILRSYPCLIGFATKSCSPLRHVWGIFLLTLLSLLATIYLIYPPKQKERRTWFVSLDDIFLIKCFICL